MCHIRKEHRDVWCMPGTGAEMYICCMLYNTSAQCDHSPPNQAEPREAVIERVSTRQHIVTLLCGTTGNLCSTVIHLPHQVQTLPAGGIITHIIISSHSTCDGMPLLVTLMLVMWNFMAHTWASPGSSNAWHHSSGPAPLQPRWCGEMGFSPALYSHQKAVSQEEAESTVCRSATQTETAPVSRHHNIYTNILTKSWLKKPDSAWQKYDAYTILMKPLYLLWITSIWQCNTLGDWRPYL